MKCTAFRIALKVCFNVVRLSVHPAFNIRDPVELSVPSYALIVNDSGLVMFSEEISHCFDVRSGIRFVPA